MLTLNSGTYTDSDNLHARGRYSDIDFGTGYVPYLVRVIKTSRNIRIYCPHLF